jgi:putative ABC transport system permease protein
VVRLPQLAPLWAIGSRRRPSAIEDYWAMAVALITPLALAAGACGGMVPIAVEVKAFGWRLPFQIFHCNCSSCLRGDGGLLLAALIP